MTLSTAARLGVVTVIWGTTWTVIRWQVMDAPAGWSVAYRFWIAGLALATFCAVRGEQLRLDRSGFRIALAAGLLQFAINFNLVYAAERHVTSGLVAVCFALLIVPNTLFAWVFVGQRVTSRFLVGSALSIAGVVLLFRQEFVQPDAFSNNATLGLLMTVGAVLAASSANVLQAGQAARVQPPLPLLANAMLIGAVVDTLTAALTSGPPPFPHSWRFWGGAAYLALAASAAAFALYYKCIREIGPAKASYSSLAVPFVAMALSTVLEDYHWGMDAIAGAVLASIGIAVALLAPAPRRALATQPA